MEKEAQALQELSDNTEMHIPIFGYELIREILLNDILGKDSPHVLYWAGKQLARKFPLHNIDETINFFSSAGWGDLTLVKQSKDEIEMTLTGIMVERRFELNTACHFQLETGFLAEQISLQRKFTAEGAEETKRRARRATIFVKLDLKDPIE
ncbi:YslB family protein [Peribacillus sp. JNUCC 23]|uniref:YslB family protein n=1 Tax=Peribacillus sp. NPDC096379 TaxID=3364393 RepID=UPI00382EF071